MQLVAKAKIYQKSWVKARKERFYRANYDSPGSFDEVARETINQKKNYDMYCTLHTLAQSTCMCMYVCLFVSMYVLFVSIYMCVCVATAKKYVCVCIYVFICFTLYISMITDVRLS
jgi:hypothetical protein